MFMFYSINNKAIRLLQQYQCLLVDVLVERFVLINVPTPTIKY